MNRNVQRPAFVRSSLYSIHFGSGVGYTYILGMSSAYYIYIHRYSADGRTMGKFQWPEIDAYGFHGIM